MKRRAVLVWKIQSTRIYRVLEKAFGKSHRESRRWIRLSNKCVRIGCPTTCEEYEVIHKMFVKTMMKSEGWRSSFYYSYTGKCASEMSTEEIWKMFISRLNYSCDRMGWRNLVIITKLLEEIETRLLDKELME